MLFDINYGDMDFCLSMQLLLLHKMLKCQTHFITEIEHASMGLIGRPV